MIGLTILDKGGVSQNRNQRLVVTENFLVVLANFGLRCYDSAHMNNRHPALDDAPTIISGSYGNAIVCEQGKHYFVVTDVQLDDDRMTVEAMCEKCPAVHTYVGRDGTGRKGKRWHTQ